MKLSRDTEDQESRRDFVRAAGRALGLAALGMIAWAAGFRHAGPGVGERRSRCRRCRMLSVCSLPGALHVRDTLGVQQDLSKLDHIDLTDGCAQGIPKRDGGGHKDPRTHVRNRWKLSAHG